MRGGGKCGVVPSVSRYLLWSDLAPEVRSFDLTLARQAVEPLVERALLSGWKVRKLENAVDQELFWHFGPWLSGWRSGELGGPVRAYYAWPEARQLFTACQIDPEPTVRRILQAVVEWQEFLEAVDRHIDGLESEPPSPGLAASRLLPVVLNTTGTHEGWVDTLLQTLGWYLESKRLPLQPYLSRFRQAFEGHFEDRIAPTSEETTRACAALEACFAEPLDETKPDLWELWCRSRCPFPRQLWEERTPPWERRLLSDGHRDYVERKEGHAGMSNALRLARAWAARGDVPLTLRTLEHWQTALTGRPQAATDEADGRLWEQLLERLELAGDPAVAADWRAAMVYLDLLVFQPFSSEGERLARLVMDAVLWREGLGLAYPEPIMLMARGAIWDDSGGSKVGFAVSELAGACPS